MAILYTQLLRYDSFAENRPESTVQIVTALLMVDGGAGSDPMDRMVAAKSIRGGDQGAERDDRDALSP